METLNLKNVYHIGTLNIEDRTNHNFEGKGVSVSVNPREWQAIARGQLSGRSYLFLKENAKFAVLDDEVLIDIKQWALKKNYITFSNIYGYEYFDDDIGRELCNVYKTLEEAQEEDLEEDDLKILSVSLPTKELKNIMKPVDVSEINPFQSLFGLYIQEKLPDYDGVWFDAELDPLGMTAPAGLIFDNKFKMWDKKEVKWNELPEKIEFY